MDSSTLSTLLVGVGREGTERRGGNGFITQQEALGGSLETPPLTPLPLGLFLVCSGVAHSRTNHCHMTLDFWRAKQTSFFVVWNFPLRSKESEPKTQVHSWLFRTFSLDISEAIVLDARMTSGLLLSLIRWCPAP